MPKGKKLIAIISILCACLLIGAFVVSCGGGSGGGSLISSDDYRDSGGTDPFKGRPPIGTSHYTGIKPFWTYDTNAIGGGGSAMVNLWSGNLVVQFTDVSFPGRGLPVEIRRTYNSQADYEGSFGMGWTCIFDAHLEFEGTDVILRDGYGGRFVFTNPQQNGDITRYTSPPGRNTVFFKRADGRYVEKKKNCTRYIFNSDGKLNKIRHRNVNNYLVMGYDGTTGKLERIREASGRVTRLIRNGDYISKIIDPEGREVKYHYEGAYLKRVTDPEGHYTMFRYNANGQLSKIINPKGIESLIHYYAANQRVKEFVDPLYKVTYKYPADYTTVEDTYGHLLTYYLNEFGNNTHTIDTMGYNTYFQWDANMNITQVTNAENQITSYTYNSKGDLLTTTNSLYTVSYTYDNNHNLISTTDGKNLTTRFTYVETPADPFKVLQSVSTPMNRTVTFSYNEFAEPVSVTNARGYSTEYQYDINGNITAVTDAADNTTTITYNNVGEALVVDVPVNGQTHFAYDQNGLVTSVQTPSGATTSYGYDANGNRVYVTNPLNVSTSYAFDEGDRMIRVTDGLMKTTTYTYQNGLLRSTEDPMGFTTTMEYDANDRMTSRSNPITMETFAYDALGNVLSKGTELGTVNNTYDDINRLIEVAMPNRRVTFTYDNNGNRLSVNVNDTGRADHSVSYVYDNDNRLTYKQKYMDNDVSMQISHYTYDTNSNLTGLLVHIRTGVPPVPDGSPNAGSVSVNFNWSYDELDRQVGASNSNDDLFTAAYDAVGNMTEIHYPDGTNSVRTFDNENRIVSVTNDHPVSQPPHIVYNYTYDLVGNYETVETEPTFTGPPGPKEYHYDPLNRLTEDEDAMLSFMYDDVGNKIKDTRTDTGVETDFTYNSAHQLIRKADSGYDQYEYRYDYDGNGNMSHKEEGYVGSEYWQNTYYEYNLVNRLLSHKIYDTYNPTYLQREERYAYDGDNELFFSEDLWTGGSATCAVGGSQLPLLSSQSRSAVIKEQSASSENQNNPRTSTTSARSSLQNNYSFVNIFHGYESGTLIFKSLTSGVVYDDVLQEEYISNSVVYYTYLNGLKVGLTEIVEPMAPSYFFAYDGQGNIVQTSNRAGTQEYACYKYSSYGVQQILEQSGGAPTGTYKGYDDGPLGFKCGVRQYDPEAGRFTSPDPFKGYLSDPQSQNPYMYCRGNPIKYADPSGYVEIPTTMEGGVEEGPAKVGKPHTEYFERQGTIMMSIPVRNTGKNEIELELELRTIQYNPMERVELETRRTKITLQPGEVGTLWIDVRTQTEPGTQTTFQGTYTVTGKETEKIWFIPVKSSKLEPLIKGQFGGGGSTPRY
jgi:RHS repeat-associated protein